MLIKINRQKAIAAYPSLPWRYYDDKTEEDIYNPHKTFGNYLLTLPSKSFKGNSKLLANGLLKLSSDLGFNEFIFMGDVDIPWLRRYDAATSSQPPLQYLADNKIGKQFSGALQVDIKELPEFIKHLCNLVRTNGIFPYIYFIDKSENIICSICQYGNLHLSTNNKEADNNFKAAIAGSNFLFLEDTICAERFSKSGIIKERSLLL